MSKVWKKIGKQQTPLQENESIGQKYPIQNAQNCKKSKQSMNKQLISSSQRNTNSKKGTQKNGEQSSNLSYSGQSIQIANFLNKNSRQSSFKNQHCNKSVFIEFQIEEKQNQKILNQQRKQAMKYSLNQVKKQIDGAAKNISGSSSIQIFIHQMKNLAINPQQVVQVDDTGDDLPKLKFNQPSEIENKQKFMIESDSVSDVFQDDNSMHTQSINHVKSFTRINKKLGSSSQSQQHQKKIYSNNIQQSSHQSAFNKITIQSPFPNYIADSKLIQSQGEQLNQSQGNTSEVLQQISLRPLQQISKSAFLKNQQPKDHNYQNAKKQSLSSLMHRQSTKQKEMSFASNNWSDKIIKSDIIHRKNNIEQDLQIRYSNRTNIPIFQNDPIAQQKQSNQDSMNVIGKDFTGQSSKYQKKGKIHLNIKTKSKNPSQTKKQNKKLLEPNIKNNFFIQRIDEKQTKNEEQLSEGIMKMQQSEGIMKISGIKSNKKINSNQQKQNLQQNQSMSHPMIKNTNQFNSSNQSVQELQISTGNILQRKSFKSQLVENQTQKLGKFIIKKEQNNKLKKNQNHFQQNQSTSKYKEINSNQISLSREISKVKNIEKQIRKNFSQNTDIALNDMNKFQRQHKTYNVIQIQYEKLMKQFQSKNQDIYFYQKQIESQKLKIEGFLEEISQLEDQKGSLQDQIKELKQCIYNSSPQFYRDFNIQNEQLKDKIKQMSLQIKILQQKNQKYQQNDNTKERLNQINLQKQKSRSSNKINLTGYFNQQHNQSLGKMSIESKIGNFSKSFQSKQYKSFQKNKKNYQEQKLPEKISKQLFPSLSISIAFPINTEIVLNCQQNRLQLQQYIFDLQQKIVWINLQRQQKAKQVNKPNQSQIQTKYKTKYKEIFEKMKQELKNIRKKYDKLKEYVQKQMSSSIQKSHQSQYYNQKKGRSKNEFNQMLSLMKNVQNFHKFMNFMNKFSQINNQNQNEPGKNEMFLGQIKEPTIQHITTGSFKKTNQKQQQKKKQTIEQIYVIKQNEKNIQKLYGALQNEWRLIQSEKKQFFNQKRVPQFELETIQKNNKDDVYFSNTSINPKIQFKKFTSQVGLPSNQAKYNQINESRSQTRYYSPQPNYNKNRSIYPGDDNNYRINYQSNQNRQRFERKHSPNYHINYGRNRQQKYYSPTKKYYQMKPTKPYLDQQDFLGLSSKLNKLRNNLNQQLNSIK